MGISVIHKAAGFGGDRDVYLALRLCLVIDVYGDITVNGMDGIVVGDVMVAAVENLQPVQVDPGLKARSAFALNEIAGQLVVTGKVINRSEESQQGTP